MGTLTARLHGNASTSPARNVASAAAKPESAYSFAAALWQESALSRITRKGTAAHLAIGPLVAKLHAGIIDCGIAESVFVNLLSIEKE